MRLRHLENRVVVQVDMNYKNSHTFSDGTKIELARKYDNFDLKYVNPVNAIVLSADNIPEGSEILIHHNSVHETNKINDYKPLSGADIASEIRYFAIPESEAFAWLDGDVWRPLDGFDFALRVFKPYVGMLHGIEPTLIKDCIYVTTGQYIGLVCRTLKSCDYQIIFQDKSGREGNLIRFRSKEDEQTKRECEIVAIDHGLTMQLRQQKLYVGLSKSDAKPINELVNG